MEGNGVGAKNGGRAQWGSKSGRVYTTGGAKPLTEGSTDTVGQKRERTKEERERKDVVWDARREE